MKQKRAAAGLTQDDLAEKTGLSKSLISQVEVGQRACTKKTALKVAEVLGCDPAPLYLESAGFTYLASEIDTTALTLSLIEVDRALRAANISLPPGRIALLVATMYPVASKLLASGTITPENTDALSAASAAVASLSREPSP